MPGAKPRLVMTDPTRLRTLKALLRGGGRASAGAAESARASVDPEALATGLGGSLEDAPLGPCPVVRWVVGPEGPEGHDGPDGNDENDEHDEVDEPYGDRLEAASRAISAEGLAVLCGEGSRQEAPKSGVAPTDGVIFFDLETTGLSAGAGTVAFVVGFGCFDGARFHVWQFVLPSFATERRLLAAVTAAVSRAHTVVTFNGKSFDMPFMEMRWLYHRLATPLPALRHLDLLHPARRFWGPDTGGLGMLERRVLGFRRRGDVSGYEIPSRYFNYLRSGDPAPLRRVLLHNRLDLASLAVLTGLACELVDGGPNAARDARQCLGLGRVYERSGNRPDAHVCYERAAGLSPGSSGVFCPGDLDVRAEALFRVASAQRGQRRHADAARVWQGLLDLRRPPGLFEREALRSLAVHHEHRLKDTHTALLFARRAYAMERTASRRQEGRKRMSRLERRLAGDSGC
ncbi:MAG: hypothetical protein CL477_06490 [Acidobacteria bacterium]|nr:hypothetical protein [Acidobacteriota bacterium]